MAQTTPPSITAAPATPQRGTRSTFSGLVDAFVTWLSSAVSQFGAVATNVYNNAVDCYNNAVAAAASATTASAAAVTASASANAVLWVSGATVAQYSCVISPANARTFRRITATGSGATDPSADGTNYVLISIGAFPRFTVREEQASGTNGGGSTAGFQTRTLNTTLTNTIAGASLSSNLVTLPAGTYEVVARAPANGSLNRHVLSLYNSSDSTTIITGSGAYDNTGNSQVDSWVRGTFTLAATKNISLRHYTNGTVATTGLGTAITSGLNEVYSEADFRKVA